MKTLLFVIILISCNIVMADQVCGTIKMVSTLDSDMITFSVSEPGEAGWKVFQVPPKEVSRLLPMVLTGLNNPGIKACVLFSANIINIDLTNR